MGESLNESLLDCYKKTRPKWRKRNILAQLRYEKLSLVRHTENMLKISTTPKTETWTLEHFRVLCAWCNVELRAPLKVASPCQPAPESHGICVQCALKMGMPADYFEQRNVA